MRLIESSPDEPDAAALLDAYFAERAAGFTGDYRVVRPRTEAFLPPGAFLLAEVDGEPAGCGGLRPLPPDAAGPRLEVKHLYAAPRFRGRGVGRTLLAALVERARSNGATTVVLDTNRSLAAAGGLYRSTGFLPSAAYNDNPNATDWYALHL